MKINISHILIISGLILISFSVRAQVDWVKPSAEIKDAQVVVEKDKVIDLRPVSRRYEPIPIEIAQVPTVKAPYEIKKIDVALPPISIQIRPQMMKPELLQKFFWGTVKLGYGNFNTAYLSASVGTKRSDEASINAQVDHLSSGKGPVDGKNSGSGTTSFVLGGKYFLSNTTLHGKVGYQRDAYRYYGYDTTLVVEEEDIKQTLNNISVNVGVANNNTEALADYALDLRYRFTNTADKTSESDLGLDFNVVAKPSDLWRVSFDVNADLITQKDVEVEKTNRRWLKAAPRVGYNLDQFKVAVGLGFYNHNDSLGSKQTHFFPEIFIGYQFAPSHQVNLSYSGAVEKVTLGSLYDQNLFLAPHIGVNHNVNPVDAKIFLSGSAGARFGYKVGAQLNTYKRYGYFVNDPLDSTRFSLVYDEGNSSRTRLFLDLSYAISHQVNLHGSVKLNGYQTADVAEAWHKPGVEASFRTHLFLFDRLSSDIDLFYLGGIKARAPVSGETIDLDGIIDINLNLSYAITPRASVFVNLMNVVGRNYQQFLNYPVRGFQVLGGLGYNF